jgi:hypothetical protein
VKGTLFCTYGMRIFVIDMAKEEKKKRPFIQKLLNPYLMMIIDEETFEEQTQIRFSRLKVFL